ncbi:MAG: hypothetical protein ACR2QS_03055 [Woeseiaceae bacterium]
MKSPRYKATIQAAEKPWDTDTDELPANRLIEISIIAAIAIALGLSGRVTALISNEEDRLSN